MKQTGSVEQVAVISLTSRNNKAENIKKAFQYVEQAVREGAEWVVLPEVFSFIGSYENLYENAEDLRGELWTDLSRLSRDLKIVLFAGSFAERLSDDKERKVANVAYAFDRTGRELARYQKIHLFSLAATKGTILLDERLGYVPGETLSSVFEVDGFRVCLAICFDLRFPGQFLYYQKNGLPFDVLVAPSAFTQSTGRDHWLLLLQARAIDNQAYVLGANQVGSHDEGKMSFGHSAIVDPWGKILSQTSEKQEGIAYSTLHLEIVKNVRRKLCLIEAQRFDLY